MATSPPSALEPDSEDSDSALGETLSSYTVSLRSSLMQRVNENGRGYHRYRDGKYLLPEDEAEQDRLDLQHEIFNKTFDGKLALSPVPNQQHHVLDLGTGTGLWVIDFADQHPEAHVIGVDLSPIQPRNVPPNYKFEIHDYDESWTFPQKFDLIHGRMLLISIASPQRLFAQAFNSLAPGGWMEMQDVAMPLTSDDGSMVGTPYERWNDLFVTACRDRLNRDPGWATRYKEWMVEAGFRNVVELRFMWPQNSWPKDKKMKELGRWNMINALDGLQGFTARLFTKVQGMPVEEMEVLLMEVRQDIQNRKIHCYWPVQDVPRSTRWLFEANTQV